MSYKVYTNAHKFDDLQMYQIRKGFESGLTIEQIEIYEDPLFDASQMREIRKGFENGLSEEQVAVYAKTLFNSYQMRQIREQLENGEQEIKFLSEDCWLSL